ncbi:hypothetical protein [Chryseobacterium sp. SIMBA_029]|uniref:hypothetical protein n=1 Tax=Chryseobacterium sp. SIMBA_029 TaxID=3085772 RepID=UPI00397BDCCE
MKHLYSLLLITLGVSAFSQTKLIAFKSHSGSSMHFNTAVSENLFDANFSNLGIVPKRMVTDAKLDSVIILNESESILVTSSASKTLPAGIKKEWRPGRETVWNNKLFSKKNIDSVKKVLKEEYYFINDMDSVVFMEYDKTKNSYKEIKPIIQKPQQEKPDRMPKGLLVGILMISGVSGLYKWKRNKKNHEK